MLPCEMFENLSLAPGLQTANAVPQVQVTTLPHLTTLDVGKNLINQSAGFATLKGWVSAETTNRVIEICCLSLLCFTGVHTKC